jgi:hypothetical protein
MKDEGGLSEKCRLFSDKKVRRPGVKPDHGFSGGPVYCRLGGDSFLGCGFQGSPLAA